MKTIDWDYYLKISSACLRHEIFGGTSDIDKALWLFPQAAYNYIASPLGYLRGYMCTSDSKDDKSENFGKKTCLTVTDALDKNVVISSELFTKSGEKNETSLYKRETVGDTMYEFQAYFDVKQAQFMSLDDYFNRKSVNSLYVEGENPLENAFNRTYGRIPYTKGVYSSKSDIFGKMYGEYGLKFDDDYVNSLIKEAIKSLLSINILRATGEAHTVQVLYKPIYSGCDINDDETNWETIGVDDLDNLNFQIHQFYIESSQHDWEDRAKAIELARSIKKEKKRTSKKSKKNPNGETSIDE